MNSEYERILEKSRARRKDIQKRMEHLQKFSRTGFDLTVRGYHDEVFSSIDCMQCGNCCRAIGPRFRDKDAKILAREIGMDARAFGEKYLKADIDENFYVLKDLPCPFFNGEDASCAVYEKRPLSCEEFPYTNTHNIQRHLIRLGHSAMFCPAAALIVQKISDNY